MLAQVLGPMGLAGQHANVSRCPVISECIILFSTFLHILEIILVKKKKKKKNSYILHL